MELTAQIVALYLGQKCEHEFGGIKTVFQIASVNVFGKVSDGDRVSVSCETIKPVLRRLESLTEAEARELYEVQNDGWYWSDEGSAVEHFFGGFDLDEGELLCGSKVWLKLLSWGFDLSGLIDSGAAIDATIFEPKKD